ncbi:hypothetical protein Tco_1313535 [Tanacetum coccineum]
MATLNEPIPQGTGSGSALGAKIPYCGTDMLKLDLRVLALENIKTAQALEITHLKKRVKKLEKKKKSRTPQLKSGLFKVRIESSVEKSLETPERYGHDIEVNTASTSVTTASINITTPEPATTASALITTTGVSVSTAKPSTPPTTTTILIDDEDLTIAQTLMKIRSVKSKEKSKEKGVTNKGKGIMQEPKKPMKVKGKDQIAYDPEVAQKLHEEWQSELEEQDRLAREKEEKALVEE